MPNDHALLDGLTAQFRGILVIKQSSHGRAARSQCVAIQLILPRTRDDDFNIASLERRKVIHLVPSVPKSPEGVVATRQCLKSLIYLDRGVKKLRSGVEGMRDSLNSISG